MFFANDAATPKIYTLSLHDALPISNDPISAPGNVVKQGTGILTLSGSNTVSGLITVNQGTLLVTPANQSINNAVTVAKDRKSTRLNSSHPSISYAVFCLKKKNRTTL